ncbi:glycoside hydrolase family 97 protein [Flavobacterium sp. NG2]|uniref:glycoside hydrolase family 97 protein n=1 Tax=Flavobacterium sp. NG2 TaxID=3097547 RepID=UPI002A813E3D|nr:glycoside hydrolase family 97 protein [Flavobacterium sp. NG2]WPR72996.1 glycoside hydrolase family 97 protein [Flavobacterium sp. NG2]
MKNIFSLSVFFWMIILNATAMQGGIKKITVKSPDGKTQTEVSIGKNISYTITQDGVQVLAPSQLAMTLSDGITWGLDSEILKSTTKSVNAIIDAPFYKTKKVKDHYNQLSILFKGNWSLEFRVYDDGVAYRFTTTKKGKYNVVSELAEYKFTNDANATVPYVYSAGDTEHQLSQSFENTYTRLKISELDKERLMFLPLSVEAPKGKRITITESDLRNYPGMYFKTNEVKNTMTAFFAPLRNDIEEHSGYNNLQVIVKSRHDYIATVENERSFPWRAAIVTRNDVDLANTTMTYKLAAENEIGNTDWIKPGKVAWDWWNNWNLDGVDFKAGINNQTYKYYIDFASKNGIEYVILDEGWSVNKVYDLMQVVPEIDLEELIAYAKERNVGIILWAGYYAFDKDMEKVCKHYSEMGVKGFKVDFMNGDDQELVYFNERAAKMCAKYKLLTDLHGTYKPAGLQRTYPNILNFEGVHGLEQMKWQPQTCDQVTYDVTLPYIRMISGPVDYTQGAMNNAVKALNTITNVVETQYYPNFSKPMSQGTRCHQLAEYVIFLSPLNMLCDAPTNYEKNPVSTEFIASIPTTWDESKTIDGKMGEYIVTARRKGDTWYIGGLNNWDAREITIDIKAITGKTGTATIFKDGLNSDMNGVDFTKKTEEVNGELTIRMAPGGGFVVKL